MKRTIEIENPLEIALRAIEGSTSYQEYRELVSRHVSNGTSTGPNQTEALAQYTLLNDSRMRRLDKTTKIPDSILEKINDFKGSQTWLVLTESWCGDAAQTMPVMNKLAELNEGIDFRVVERDNNPELINAFLTNGAQSIPKLIVLDNNTNRIIGEWGPRPSTATDMVNSYKKEHGSLSPEFKQDLQVWYNKDKGVSVAEDLTKLFK
jgi:thiol-disulfide isomerase/thioredoxin